MLEFIDTSLPAFHSVLLLRYHYSFRDRTYITVGYMLSLVGSCGTGQIIQVGGRNTQLRSKG